MKSLFAILSLAVSLTATLSAQEAPQIDKNPFKKSLTEGDRMELTVEVSGDPAPTIKWYRNGQLLSNFTGTTLLIEQVLVSDSGRYYIEATNSEGSVFSEHARVIIRPNHFDKSVARQWMEENLAAIRIDYPAPTNHSRNMFANAIAMYDTWCAYNYGGVEVPYLVFERPPLPDDLYAARNEAISYAAYTVLSSRYRYSPSADTSLEEFRQRMEHLGYDPDNRSLVGNSPAAVGNRIGTRVLGYTLNDASNERKVYADQTSYAYVNESLVFKIPGVGNLADPNHWQRLAFDFFVTQNGFPQGALEQKYLGANWGWVRPFSLTRDDPNDVYQDPGPPPYISTDTFVSTTEDKFKSNAVEVIKYSSWLDPNDPTTIDAGPGARHNNELGTNDGTGYPEGNPYTGQAYEPNIVLRADYGRILAEFWADGPDSETPPGHWNAVANHISEYPGFNRKFMGEGPSMYPLEWDVKMYFALNGAVSDAAIACWDSKRKYNYVRPITMIRYMGELGQSSDPDGPSYHEHGLPLVDNLITVVTAENSAPGEPLEHLADYVGLVAIRCWQGVPENPATQTSGVDWILADSWMPFQRDTFVTPPFAAYTSGHSTFSRAAAEVLTLMTGSKYFPGGISTFEAKKNAFLEFELGPTEDIALTWATYYDAADEAGISRVYGGIHVQADDFGGRIMGSNIGKDAFAKALTYFQGTAQTLETTYTYEAWAAIVAEQDPENAGPADYFLDSTLTNLERFVYGLEPFDKGLRNQSFQIVNVDTTARLASAQVELFEGTNATFRIRLSSNMKDWTEVSMEEAVDSMVSTRQGRVLYTIKDLQTLSNSNDARYIQIVYDLPQAD